MTFVSSYDILFARSSLLHQIYPSWESLLFLLLFLSSHFFVSPPKFPSICIQISRTVLASSHPHQRIVSPPSLHPSKEAAHMAQASPLSIHASSHCKIGNSMSPSLASNKDSLLPHVASCGKLYLWYLNVEAKNKLLFSSLHMICTHVLYGITQCITSPLLHVVQLIHVIYMVVCMLWYVMEATVLPTWANVVSE